MCHVFYRREEVVAESARGHHHLLLRHLLARRPRQAPRLLRGLLRHPHPRGRRCRPHPLTLTLLPPQDPRPHPRLLHHHPLLRHPRLHPRLRGREGINLENELKRRPDLISGGSSVYSLLGFPIEWCGAVFKIHYFLIVAESQTLCLQ